MSDAEVVREIVQPLTGCTRDYDALLELIGEARIVLLGEASHGTHEFYFERATITKRLIAEKHFTVLAIEADWPDASRVHRYVRDATNNANANEALAGFRRFPTWMWRNAVMVEFVEWLRDFNKTLDPKKAPAGFYGMDLYSLHASIDAVLNYLAKVESRSMSKSMTEIRISAEGAMLEGNLTIVDRATGLVLFVHGSGSSRHSPRNQFVARTLNNAGLATLLFDLLTPEEEMIDMRTAELRFDIDLLAERLMHATKWAKAQTQTRDLTIGYFGSSTGGAAALVAAAQLPAEVDAVVSRGGRPDLAGDYLPKVKAPTLLIVGGEDHVVIDLNEQARAEMRCEVKIDIVPGATHLFEEPGALEQVATLASNWFTHYLGANEQP